MKPIYFPFTTISEPLLGSLLACFKQVVIYQPSREHVPAPLRNWEAMGRLEIRMSGEEGNDPLPHLLKAYRAWAELHRGERPDFEKFHPRQTPYYDESAASRIRSDIRKATEGADDAPSREETERSMLLRSRLFLTVAQEHDQLRQALREDLLRIDGMAEGLLRNLFSEQEAPLPVTSLNRPVEAAGTESSMPGERMSAWARLHLHYRKKTDVESVSTPETPDLLITSDPSALDQLLVQSGEADKVITVSGVPYGPLTDLSGDAVFIEQLQEKLRNPATGPVRSTDPDLFFPDAGSEARDTGRLTIYRVKGDAVARFLSNSGSFPEPSGSHQTHSEKQYTLLGGIIKKGPV